MSEQYRSCPSGRDAEPLSARVTDQISSKPSEADPVIVTTAMGGKRNPRFDTQSWAKRPFVHEADDGSYTPQ